MPVCERASSRTHDAMTAPTMTRTTYTNLINEALDLYRKEKFWEAYLLITDNSGHEPRNDAQLADFRCSLACRAGKPDLAMEIMKDSIVKKGFWYRPNYMLEDQDMAPLRGYPGFADLVELCRVREEAGSTAPMEIELVASNDPWARDRPLIVVLHGNMQKASIAREDWGLMPELGYDLAFVQSSQVSFSEAYVWDDLGTGTADLQEAFRRLSAMEGARGREIILAGFSAGARLALRSVIDRLVKVKGLVLVGPWLPEIDQWRPELPSMKEKIEWAYILCGDQDPECLPGAKTLADEMTGKRCALRVVPGLVHEYPTDFAAELHRYIEEMGL